MFLIRLLALALVMIAPLAHAEPYFIHKEGAMVLDKATGLMWMRCSVGQKWDGKTCTGEGRKLMFDEAKQTANDLNSAGGFGGYNDWSVPTVRQLQSLRSCSTGYKSLNAMDIKDGGVRIDMYCNDDSTKPAIVQSEFPKTAITGFWSSTPSVYSNGKEAWCIDFNTGSLFNAEFNRAGYSVRLARVSQILSDTVPLGFISLDADQSLILAAVEKTKKIENELREAERRRAEKERVRAEGARAAALKKLIAGGAQSLYLQAGKAQRSGSVDVNGVSFSADEMYELIVEKFSNSDYAVKATDQLTAMGRSDRQAGAVRDAANATASAQRDVDRNSSNRAACFSQVRSCEAGCSRTDGISYHQYCTKNCQRTCN